jgi:predicted nucleic acid-binding protein
VTVLVDTSVLVDHLRGDHRAVALLRDVFRDEERVWAATPTRAEILAGVRPAERERMTRLFGLLSWVEIDVEVADAAGEMARRFRRSHSGIDTTDYLIAAAANSIGAVLLTQNVKHFPMFGGLQTAYGGQPTEARRSVR